VSTEPMPVMFAVAETRAHVMQWNNAAQCWASPCGWNIRRIYTALGGDAAYGDVPSKPWCSGCRRYAGRVVAGFAASGILVDAGDPYGD
jgi:hypothetical protein